MRSILLFAAAACLAPAVAGAADLSGSWKFQGTGPRGPATAMTCKLTRAGDSISGSCVSPQGSTVEVAGTVTGDQVDIGYNPAGSPLHVDFKGVIQSDGTIKGTVAASTPPTPFIGTRQ